MIVFSSKQLRMSFCSIFIVKLPSSVRKQSPYRQSGCLFPVASKCQNKYVPRLDFISKQHPMPSKSFSISTCQFTEKNVSEKI
jgi:hypothetical protein